MRGWNYYVRVTPFKIWFWNVDQFYWSENLFIIIILIILILIIIIMCLLQDLTQWPILASKLN